MFQTVKYFIPAFMIIALTLIVVPVYGILFLITTIYLRVWLWLTYVSNGTRILFIYSNSPTWQTYIEENMLPVLLHRSAVLNWSERTHWSRHEHALVDHFMGEREFNPSAIIFVSFWKVERIRLYQAFRDYQHGNEHSLRMAEQELNEIIQVIG